VGRGCLYKRKRAGRIKFRGVTGGRTFFRVDGNSWRGKYSAGKTYPWEREKKPQRAKDLEEKRPCGGSMASGGHLKIGGGGTLIASKGKNVGKKTDKEARIIDGIRRNWSKRRVHQY